MMVTPKHLIAEDVIPTEILQKDYTKEQLVKKVYQYADKYGVNPHTMVSIINCENQSWDTDLQSGLRYKKGNRWGYPAGTQEKSYGLAQIHLPDNKQITLEEAQDPNFSLDFMASNISKGRAKMWSCYKGNA